jgi:hypothetical protein
MLHHFNAENAPSIPAGQPTAKESGPEAMLPARMFHSEE